MEYGKAKLFGPLGIKDLHWWNDPQGISVRGFGLFVRENATLRPEFFLLCDKILNYCVTNGLSQTEE
jgi:hypothetical protein